MYVVNIIHKLFLPSNFPINFSINFIAKKFSNLKKATCTFTHSPIIIMAYQFSSLLFSTHNTSNSSIVNIWRAR